MSALTNLGDLRWELRGSDGEIVSSNNREPSACYLRVYTTDGEEIDIELFHRGDRGFIVRGVMRSLEILPEAANSVIVQTRPRPAPRKKREP